LGDNQPAGRGGTREGTAGKGTIMDKAGTTPVVQGASGAEPSAGAPAARTVRPEFTGSAGEYFRIWIVNLFFSLVTLGIYSAWAKVRKKKYFYGSTRLDGQTFDYFGRPKAILKGRVIAVLAFIVYALAGELYPYSRYAFWAVAIAVLPWLVVRALTFNARNSAHRGLRFHFSGTPKQAAGVYIGTFILAVLTAGLAYPLFVVRQKAFVLESHAFGLSQLRCELSAWAFFWIYVRALLIVLAVALPSFLAITFAVRGISHLPDWLSWMVWALPVLGMYAGYAVAYAYVQARTTNLLWNGTSGTGFRFSSSLSATKLVRIYIGNIVAVACSGGLLIPWAVVRTLKYRLENFTMILDGDIVHEANPAFARVGATGQELGDFFNLDLGL
jgi:uncharacterized membrane protein YjgN (DUF898 family)